MLTPGKRLVAGALLIVMLLAGVLFTMSNDFPLGYHFDEPKKVSFVQNNIQDFLHPILLLELSRWSVAIFAIAENDQSIVQVGRSVSAAAGVLCVLLMFFLGRRAMGSNWGVVVALLTATCPAMIVHAHYMKEDMVLLAALLASLLALERMRESATTGNAVLLGLCAGLAFSSHYKSILLLPIAGIYLAIQAVLDKPTATQNGEDSAASSDLQSSGLQSPLTGWTDLLLLVALAGCVACLVFATINYPALEQWSVFERGVSHEYQHALDGHRGMRLTPWDEMFTYHLRTSIVSGMTIGMALLAFVGLVLQVRDFSHAAPVTRLMLVFSGTYYLVAELSPTKPPPDEMRYVLPCMLGGIFLAGLALKAIATIPTKNLRTALLTVCILGGPFYAAIDGTLVAWHLKRDSRSAVQEWIATAGIDREQVYFSVFAAANPTDRSLSIDLHRIRESGAEYWVLSSFTYEPVLYASQFPDQSPQVMQQADMLRHLLALPNREFPPQYRSIGFSDPTLRLFDLRQLATQLDEIQ